MSDPVGDIPNEETWPPAPTLPPPEAVPAPSFVALHPLLARILISLAVGLFMSALNVVSQLVTHRLPTVEWIGPAIAGFGMFAWQMYAQSHSYQLWKQKRSRMRRPKS